MNELEQLQSARSTLQSVDLEYPGRRRRRLVAIAVAIVVVIAFTLCAVTFALMNNRIDKLDSKVTQQSNQIHQLQSNLNSVKGSLSAAVACLETVGSLEGLCTKLVK